MYIDGDECVVLTQFGQRPEGDKVATPGHCKQQQCQLQITCITLSVGTNLERDACVQGTVAPKQQLLFCFTFMVVAGSPEKRDRRFRSTSLT